ncbi:MAG: hypothetical protein K8S13_02260, partial [Desulfobacula sp.]|uniref:LptE family protein n=1 Tax=Desulfobacula sp. TaxID=2593537 RepID=UPI0025C4A38B
MKNLKWFLFICLLVFFASCGYRFEGGGYIKNDVMRVAVKVFENKSSETGAGISFTNALIQEIIQKTDTKVVDESRATAVLKGTINAIGFATLSRSTTESVIERRVWASVDLKLIDKDGEVIWSVKDFSSHEEYTVSEDKITDES